jgi:hypothetical protein
MGCFIDEKTAVFISLFFWEGGGLLQLLAHFGLLLAHGDQLLAHFYS